MAYSQRGRGAGAPVPYREGPDNKDVFSGGIGRPAEAWCQDFVPLVALCQGLASAGLFQHQRAEC